VDPSDPSEIERVAVKYMRKHVRLFNTKLNILTPADCFEAATADGSNTIFLIPEAEIDITEELEILSRSWRPKETPFRGRRGSEVVNNIGKVALFGAAGRNGRNT
jgi:hypothetical protein